MKKQLPTNGIANELVGSSVFFASPAATERPQHPIAAKPERVTDATRPRAISRSIKPPSRQQNSMSPGQHDSTVPSHHATMPPEQSATTATDNHPAMREDKQAPMPPQTSESLATDEFVPAPTPDADVMLPATLEELRKAVKPIGKEAATYRLTVTEKEALADIVYTYQRQRTKTSENEIARIAINWLLLNYRTHKAHSVLARLLDLLHG